MTPAELREDVGVELEALETIVQELMSLQADVADCAPTVREQTAAAAFLAQFYTGVENILKRISAYHNVPVPTGDGVSSLAGAVRCVSRSGAGAVSPFPTRGLA